VSRSRETAIATEERNVLTGVSGLARTLQKNESGAQMRVKTRPAPAAVPATGQGTGSRAVLCRTRNRLETGRQIRVEWRNAGTASAQPVLVQPGSVIPLNESAAALLELCDGTRSFDEVVEQFVAQPGNAGLAADAQDFLEAARQRGWIVEV
jgi:pyrroloquinoline quinone biosynthesis protein D